MKAQVKHIEVPFHRACVGEEEVQAVAEVVRSGWLTTGPKTIEFERRFGEFVGTKHCIAVNSCTAALHLALEAVGIGPGDEVLVPTNTFTATGETVAYMGAKPVLVDIDAASLNMSVSDLEKKMTPSTKAVIPVHLAGQPCDMDEIHAIASSRKIHVIEDAAHALPSSYRGKMIGTTSELTAFSFYATKTLTTGEGGMITTNDDMLAERMKIMRLHGIGRDAWKRYTKEGSWFYEVVEAGFKYNLTDIAAALGIIQLRKCDSMAAERARIAGLYNLAFDGMETLQVPTVAADRKSAWHLYILRLNLDALSGSRDKIIEQLRGQGVSTSVHFIPLHLHPFYQRKYGYKFGDFPTAEQEYSRYLSLPIFPSMTNEEIDTVISAVLGVVDQNLR